jgi:hypothetical protein
MATDRQALGTFGEERVTRDCSCPKCKRSKTVVRLPQNFKCADVICDFCGYLAQVKSFLVPLGSRNSNGCRRVSTSHSFWCSQALRSLLTRFTTCQPIYSALRCLSPASHWLLLRDARAGLGSFTTLVQSDLL